MVNSCYHTLLFISFSVFQLVRCDGKVLLPYKDNLLEVLGHVLQLKCVHGYELAGQLLRFTLRALTLEFILNFQSVAGSYDRPVSEYLAIRVSRLCRSIMVMCLVLIKYSFNLNPNLFICTQLNNPYQEEILIYLSI